MSSKNTVCSQPEKTGAVIGRADLVHRVRVYLEMLTFSLMYRVVQMLPHLCLCWEYCPPRHTTSGVEKRRNVVLAGSSGLNSSQRGK